MRVATRMSLISGGAVAIILIIGITSFISVSNLIAANKLFSHSREVLQELNLLLYNLSDAVGTQRVYMITGQDIYADAYRALISSTNESMEKVKQLVSDNPVQTLRADKLSTLIKERLASLETTNNLYQQKGMEAAFYRVRTGNSLKFRISLHKAIDEMRMDEVELLQKREVDLKRSAASTQLTIFSGTCLALTLIILFSYLFGKYIVSSVGQLIRAVDNIRYNRFDVSVPDDANDEFGELASAFNSVGYQLLTMSNKLKKREEEITAIMSQLQVNENKSSQPFVTLFQRFNQVIKSNGKYPTPEKPLSNTNSQVEGILKSWQESLANNNGKTDITVDDPELQPNYKGENI